MTIPAELWVLLISLLFLITDFIASYKFSNKKPIRFDRVLENVQTHVLLRVSSLLALIPLTPLYVIAQQHKTYQLDNSLLNILLVIVIYDFSYYWFHRYSHYAKPLWILHVVHHQPEQLEASLSLRDSFLSPVITWVLAVPLIYIGFPGEVVVTAFLIHTFYQMPCHNHWFPRIKWLEYMLITPSLHRVHHGKNKPYVNKNFGNIFSIWDRLFLSLQTETEGEVIVGVKEKCSHNIFLANLQLILQQPVSDKEKNYRFNSTLLKITDSANVAFLLLSFYFYYLTPSYLFTTVCLSVLVYLYSHKRLQYLGTE